MKGNVRSFNSGTPVAPDRVQNTDDDENDADTILALVRDPDSDALDPYAPERLQVETIVVPHEPEVVAESEAEAQPEAEAEAQPEEPSPDEVAAQEQEELLQERARAWHERKWLRALFVIAVLVGVAAIIPYPLHITSDCTIIPRERVNVRSELKGVLSEILVEEGHTVKKGDVIARLDDRALQADRLKTVADVERFEADVAILKKGHRPEEIKQQEAVLAARRNEAAFGGKEAYRRSQMVKEGVGSQQSADESNRELETRRRAVAEAEAALQLLKAGSRPEEIASHEAVLKRAKAELTYIDEKIAMSSIRAPIDGEILTPRFRERINEGVEMGGLICEIANTQHMRAEVFVPQRDVDVIALGMPVVVKVESYPSHPFEGTVGFISPAVDGADRRVRVVVELDNASGLLKPNMSGYGEVEAGKRSLLNLATRRLVRWVRVRFLI